MELSTISQQLLVQGKGEESPCENFYELVS